MASNEKKVSFGLEDKASPGINKIAGSILDLIKKQNVGQKEQNSLLKDEIKLLEEKKAILEKTTNTLVKKAQKTAPGYERQEANYRAVQSRGELNLTSEAISILQKILEQSEKNTSNSERAEKDAEKARAKKLRIADREFAAKESLWRQEVNEDKSGVISRIRAGKKAGYENLSPDQAHKLMFQERLIGDKGDGKGIFGQVFAGTLAAGIVQNIASSMSKIVTAQTGEQAFNSLLGGIPLFGGILGGASDRAFNQQYDVETKRLALRGLTGNQINKRGTGSLAESLGYSSSESLDLQGALIRARGNVSGQASTENAILLQKNFGLSTETITQIVKDIRTTRSSADIMQIASDVIAANPELKKDQTKFAEILQQTSQLTNQLASQSENIDPRRSAGIVGSLRAIGGSFADPVLGVQRMMNINSALTNPSNDFSKARSFGVLSGLNPGASYFQLLEQQEKGIGANGYLTGTLSAIKRATGGGENMMLGVMREFNLQASTSRKVVEAFNKNPALFNKIGSTQELEKTFGDLQKRAKENVAPKDLEKALNDNKFATGALEGSINMLDKTIQAATSKIATLFGASQSTASAIGAGISNYSGVGAINRFFDVQAYNQSHGQ